MFVVDFDATWCKSGRWFGCHFYFPINIGLLIIPIDVHIFQRGSNHQPEITFGFWHCLEAPTSWNEEVMWASWDFRHINTEDFLPPSHEDIYWNTWGYVMIQHGDVHQSCELTITGVFKHGSDFPESFTWWSPMTLTILLVTQKNNKEEQELLGGNSVKGNQWTMICSQLSCAVLRLWIQITPWNQNHRREQPRWPSLPVTSEISENRLRHHSMIPLLLQFYDIFYGYTVPPGPFLMHSQVILLVASPLISP